MVFHAFSHYFFKSMEEKRESLSFFHAKSRFSLKSMESDCLLALKGEKRQRFFHAYEQKTKKSMEIQHFLPVFTRIPGIW